MDAGGIKGLRFEVRIRYECRQCGWRWTEVFHSERQHPERTITVPGDRAPCCAQESGTDSES